MHHLRTSPIAAAPARPAAGVDFTRTGTPTGGALLPAQRALFCSLAAALCMGAAAQAAELRVQRVEIIDQQGFDKPMLAATMLVPAGWRHQGSVKWQAGAPCGKAYAWQLTATAPDGVSAIELVPGEAWAHNNHGMGGNGNGAGNGAGNTQPGGCPVQALRTTQEYLTAWVQRHRPGARWLDYRARPDKSRAGPQHQMTGGRFSSRVEGGQALIAYAVGGREVRETLVAVVAFTQSELAGVQGQVMASSTGESFGVLGWRAPEGQLDFKQFDAVWDTLRAAPEWRQRIDTAEAQMAQDNSATQARISQIRADTSRETLAQMARRGEIRAQTQRDVADIRNNTWQARQDSNDRMHTDNVRAVREVQGWRDPRSGGVVELSNHYRHAWQLRDGSYVLTDNPNFDPSRDLGVSGVAMAPSKR